MHIFFTKNKNIIVDFINYIHSKTYNSYGREWYAFMIILKYSIIFLIIK